MKFKLTPVLFSTFLSPAIPAGFFLFGLTFLFAIVHIAGFAWNFNATVIFYSSLFVWVVLLTWLRREVPYAFGLIDALFLLFISTVVTSTLVHGYLSETVKNQMYYLPFMVLAPYQCGRLMCSADIGLLSKITICMGLAVLLLMLIDFLVSPSTEAGRWPFFGLDHGPLLVASLLSITLISISAKVVASSSEQKNVVYTVFFTFISILIIVLVWVKARGFFFISIVGVFILAWSAKNRDINIRLGLVIFVLAISVIALKALPEADISFYEKLLSHPHISSMSIEHKEAPILGLDSCKPFEESENSTAMRWVLYQEAVAIFIVKPLFGIGAGRFGDRSCTGSGGFPHSTVLQSFSELGIVGGCTLLGLLFVSILTLVRKCIFIQHNVATTEAVFVLGLFLTFLLLDQIYGNYFMMVGTSLMLGITARIEIENKKACEVYG
jgi:hypothetical protein